MPTGVKGEKSQTAGSSGPLRARMGSECFRERKGAWSGLSRYLGASLGLVNIQHVDSQKSMLIYKILLPRATLSA